MRYFANDAMFVNKFVEVALPTKKQIFGRTGQRAVQPSGSYSGDEDVHFADTPTSGLARMCDDAENYSVPSEDPKVTKSDKK